MNAGLHSSIFIGKEDISFIHLFICFQMIFLNLFPLNPCLVIIFYMTYYILIWLCSVITKVVSWHPYNTVKSQSKNLHFPTSNRKRFCLTSVGRFSK